MQRGRDSTSFDARGHVPTIHVAMLISKGLLTRRVQQPGERTVETDPDLHVVVLALRLDVCEFFVHVNGKILVKLLHNTLLIFINLKLIKLIVI